MEHNSSSPVDDDEDLLTWIDRELAREEKSERNWRARASTCADLIEHRAGIVLESGDCEAHILYAPAMVILVMSALEHSMRQREEKMRKDHDEYWMRVRAILKERGRLL
jgi:hypothetical protein